MGCVLSRPSESFFSELFGQPSETKAKEKHTATTKNVQSKKAMSNQEHIDAKTGIVSKDRNDYRGLTYEEEVARADLRIYKEEMKAKKAEEEHRVYRMHCALNRNGDWVF